MGPNCWKLCKESVDGAMNCSDRVRRLERTPGLRSWGLSRDIVKTWKHLARAVLNPRGPNPHDTSTAAPIRVVGAGRADAARYPTVGDSQQRQPLEQDDLSQASHAARCDGSPCETAHAMSRKVR